jgi:hypothetical protein
MQTDIDFRAVKISFTDISISIELKTIKLLINVFRLILFQANIILHVKMRSWPKAGKT